jgi:hypothetical protein
LSARPIRRKTAFRPALSARPMKGGNMRRPFAVLLLGVTVLAPSGPARGTYLPARSAGRSVDLR